LKQEALNRQQMGQEIAAYRQEMRKRLTIYRQKVQQQAAADRQESRHERESLAAVLVPVVLLAGGMWVALLAFGNVRERRPEIALYRALGLRTYQILLLFLGRAGVIGLVGGSLGYLAGTIAGTFGGGTIALQPLEISWNPWLLAGVMVAGPLLAVLFSWIPAFLAAQQDPAVALQSE
jgi:ABC-type antimicrobial peptide transport system permease subunit